MTPVLSLPQLRTPGVIAREIGEPLPRVQYVLNTRPHIRPTAVAGRLRLYDRQAVAQVRHELNAIDAKRVERNHTSRGEVSELGSSQSEVCDDE